MKPVRLGAGAGYSGDRIEPAVELAEKGRLDYLVFECLAERTIALAQQEKRKDPSRGYDPLLSERMSLSVAPIGGSGWESNPSLRGSARSQTALKAALVTRPESLPRLEKHDSSRRARRRSTRLSWRHRTTGYRVDTGRTLFDRKELLHCKATR